MKHWETKILNFPSCLVWFITTNYISKAERSKKI